MAACGADGFPVGLTLGDARIRAEPGDLATGQQQGDQDNKGADIHGVMGE
jgi:hypothetical protein